MEYVVTLQHPADVHFFKHTVRELESDGHAVHVFCKDRGIIRDLLEYYGIPHEALADRRGSLAAMAVDQLVYEARLFDRIMRIRPDVVTAVGGFGISHITPLVGARSVVFSETEHPFTNKIAFPLADEVWTPTCFHGRVRTRHVTYPGYQELAYLHPDRFEPDPGSVEAAGLDPHEQFVVLRLSAWDAAHDINVGGLDDPADVVDRLEATGASVVISDEENATDALDDRGIQVEPHRMHDLLAYANLFVGEGATMAAESAVLGTPAVYVNTLRMGYTDELEARYGLLYNCQGAYRHENAVETAVALLEGGDHDWERRREQLLHDTRDVTDVILSALQPGRSAGRPSSSRRSRDSMDGDGRRGVDSTSKRTDR